MGMASTPMLRKVLLLWLSLVSSILLAQGQTTLPPVAADQEILVITVIDIGGPDQGSLSRSWFNFRTNWPDRPFCVLRLEGAEPILAPSAMFRDDNVVVHTINRDGGETFKRSDWFDLCQVEEKAESTRKVAIMIDVSIPVIAASVDYFEEQMAERLGYDILMGVPRQDNNWIEAMNVPFTTSAAPSNSPSDVPSVSPSDRPSSMPSVSPSLAPSVADGNSASAEMRLSMIFREGSRINAQQDFNQEQFQKLEAALKTYLNDYMQTEVEGNTYVGTTARVTTTSEVGDNEPNDERIIFYDSIVSAKFRSSITDAQFRDILEALNTVPLAFEIYLIDDEFVEIQQVVSFEVVD